MIRIKNKFKELKQKEQKAFGVFLTAGYPSLEYSKEIFKKILDAKVDFIEIGLPFSDPMADGPLIQHSSQIAIQQNTSVEECFEIVKGIRKKNNDIPIILMGYYNPIHYYGNIKFIKKYNLIPIQHIDTAGAAEEVSRLEDPKIAAIASNMAAKIYDLQILKNNIEDAEHNTTRFLIMARDPQTPSVDIPIPVTTIIFEVRSVPAALYKVLGGFATNGINLTKLESYIGGKEMNAARFYVDAEGHPDTKPMQNALEEMYFYSEPNSVKIIGTYSRAKKN